MGKRKSIELSRADAHRIIRALNRDRVDLDNREWHCKLRDTYNARIGDIVKKLYDVYGE